jgi:hypothetical protein
MCDWRCRRGMALPWEESSSEASIWRLDIGATRQEHMKTIFPERAQRITAYADSHNGGYGNSGISAKQRPEGEYLRTEGLRKASIASSRRS